MDDSVNTAKLIKALEQNENFTIFNYEMEVETESDSLYFSMRDLFTRLNSGCIA